MNVNHDLKTIWWLPTRTASRSVSEIPAYYKFVNLENNLPLVQSYTHTIGIPNGCEDYTIICNIRNPYAKVLSTWHLRHFSKNEKTGKSIIEMSFSEFLTRYVSNNSEEHQILQQSRKPDIYIRMENLVDDLHQVPFIDFDNLRVKEIIEDHIKKNGYTYEGDCQESDIHLFQLKRDQNNSEFTDYMSYYKNQNELDIVWNAYETVFREFGYQREFICQKT
jgi:hypothetical protein